MIELQHIDGRVIAIRLCRGSSPAEINPPYQASGLVVITPGDPPGQAGFHLLTGEWRRSDLRELLQTLVDLGITRLVATRIGKHTLPFSTPGANGEHIVDVAGLARRFLPGADA